MVRFPLFDRRTTIFRSMSNFLGISNTPFDFDFDFVCISARSPTHNVPQHFETNEKFRERAPAHTHTHTAQPQPVHGATHRSLFSVRFLRIHGTYVRARHLGYVSNDTNINCLQQKQQEKIAGKNILITAISNKRSFFSLSPYRVTPSIFSTDLHNGRTTCIHITHTHTPHQL